MKIRFIPFDKLPYSDTCWSLIEGPDEKVYAAACCEHGSGGTAFVVRYDPRTEQLEYLLDIAELVGEPPTNGRAGQCKIHYSMVIDDEGIMYAATHLSGPALDQVSYSPWSTFNDPARSFVGARMFAYDTRSEQVLWRETLIPWEGCRCLALDPAGGRLYAVGYPRDHFYVFDLRTRRCRDLGRIGSVNPQAIWLDRRGRAYTTDDYGKLLVFDPQAGELIPTDIQAPHAPYQNGWHNVVYDVVQVPGSDEVVGVSWNSDAYLFRFSPGEQPGSGEMQNLGPACPGIAGYGIHSPNTEHAGGLVFSAGGELLLSVSRTEHGTRPKRKPKREAWLKAMNLQTGRTREVCALRDEKGVQIGYISRAVRIGPEHLVMGVVGPVPTGIVHVVLDGEVSQGPCGATPRRYWG